MAIDRTNSSLALCGMLLLIATPAHAHHPGGVGNTGGAGAINTIPAETLPQGVSAIAFTTEYIGLDPLSDRPLARAAERAAAQGGDHSHVHSMDSIWSGALTYAYGLTSDLTIGARLPYVARQDIRAGHFHEDDGEGEVERHGDVDGIGDVALFAQYRFLHNRASQIEAALLLGLKTPTGETDKKDDMGETFDAEFQPGTGSWDPSFGLALTKRAGQWAFDANVLYTVVSEGIQSTDLGDRFHYNVGVSYRLTGLSGSTPMYNGAHGHSHSSAEDYDRGHVHEVKAGAVLDLVLELNGEWHDNQETDGHKDENSGGHVLYVAPGLRLSQDMWSGFVSVGIPIVDDLNGLQAGPDVRLVSGVSMGF